MMNDLLQTINSIIDLLQACGWDDRADWFIGKRNELTEHAASNHEAYKSILQEIRSVLAGQGSFTDLPLAPKPESPLTREEARKQQWDLAKKLDVCIQDAL